MFNTTPISKLFLLFVLLISAGCNNDSKSLSKKDVFKFINEQTPEYVAVYGSKKVNQEAYNRAYTDVKLILDNMNSDIKAGLLNSKIKMLVVKNEKELEDNIDFFITLLPVESVYTGERGVDETLVTTSGVGISNTKLELMYLCVYYSLLTESNLSDKYNELKTAYSEANDANIFSPGEAYVDGHIDEIHENASKNNALKYGSYLYNLYKLYFGNGADVASEFSFTTKKQLQAQNPLGYNFISNYFE